MRNEEETLEYLTEKCEEIFESGKLSEEEEMFLTHFRDSHYSIHDARISINEERQDEDFFPYTKSQVKQIIKNIFIKNQIPFPKDFCVDETRKLFL